MKPPICKKNLADIPGSETFNLIPHLLRLEPSFGRSSVTNPQTDSRIMYNRYNYLTFNLTVTCDYSMMLKDIKYNNYFLNMIIWFKYLK